MLRNNGLVAYFLLFLRFAATSSGEEDPASMVITQDDFPLRPGIVVEYKSESNLKEMDATIIRQSYTEGANIGGINYVKRNAEMSDGTKQTLYFYKSDEGIIRIPAISSKEKTILVKLPLNIGTSWIHEDFEGSKIIKSDKKAEAIETITTPLGDLKCIKIRQRKADASDNEEDSFLWVAKEYGIVRIEINKKTKDRGRLKTVLTISKFEDIEKAKDKKEGK
jgi:hypothetical protein